MNVEAQPEVLISQTAIADRIGEIAEAITRDYRGHDLTVLGVLNGSFVFMADLVRRIPLPMRCDFLGLSSYGTATESSGVVAITKDLSGPIEGRDLLVVEDIVDTGLTLAYLQENLRTRHPRTVRTVALLSKPARRVVNVEIDYLGFTIEDRFVVGYGLDYAGEFRNLPYIGRID